MALLVIVAVLGFSWWLRQRQGSENRSAAIEANNRGIVLVEQFRCQDAIPEFEEAVRLAPDWLPGRINLGIALLNAGASDRAHLARARTVLEEVLRKAPENPEAHFCLGILLIRQEEHREAIQHFEAVLRKDPNDAYSWYWLGTLKVLSVKRTECYRQAVKRNRHLADALYGLAMEVRRSDPKTTEALLAECEALKQVEWTNNAAIRSGEMGPYAEVVSSIVDPCDKPLIGPLSRFQPTPLEVRLAPGTRWASAADLGNDAASEVRRLVRARFGGTLVVLDYNRDGRPDLFLAAAVVEKGQVRDLLLRNDGGGRYTDVTAEAGLAQPRPTLGCVVGDFDNDRFPDLLLTGVGVQKMFRNTGNGKFEDVTAKAGLDDLTSVCLGATFIDLDHDGNLDFLICQYATTPLQAVDALKGAKTTGGFAVFLNVGTAPPVKAEEKRPPLTCAFRRNADMRGLKGEQASLTGLAVADLDSDGDLDLFVLADRGKPAPMLNDRLLRFYREELLDSLVPIGAWNGVLVLDADHDNRSDLFLIGAGQPPRLLLNRVALGSEDTSQWFKVLTTAAPPLRQAVAVDLDLDSWTDVIGLSADGKPVLLHNKGGRLEVEAGALGGDWPPDLVGLTVADLNDEDQADLIIWSESAGLQWRKNERGGNHGLHLELACTKQRDHGGPVRCSADGFGTRVVVHAGAVWAGQERTTLSAGLGQSWQPLLLGLGASPRANVVRVHWPDGMRQTERGFLSGRRNLIEWRQRKRFW